MRVFFLDDVRDHHFPDDDVTIARTFEEAVEIIQSEEKFDLWSLDHDLGMITTERDSGLVLAIEVEAPSGYDFLKWVTHHALDKWPDEVRVHSANPVGAKNMISWVENVEKHLL